MKPGVPVTINQPGTPWHRIPGSVILACPRGTGVKVRLDRLPINTIGGLERWFGWSQVVPVVKREVVR